MAGYDWGWMSVQVAVREAFGRVGLFESIWYKRKRPGFHPLALTEKHARRALGRLDMPYTASRSTPMDRDESSDGPASVSRR
jgi:hypothetical protein